MGINTSGWVLGGGGRGKEGEGEGNEKAVCIWSFYPCMGYFGGDKACKKWGFRGKKGMWKARKRILCREGERGETACHISTHTR